MTSTEKLRKELKDSDQYVDLSKLLYSLQDEMNPVVFEMIHEHLIDVLVDTLHMTLPKDKKDEIIANLIKNIDKCLLE